MTTGQTNRIDLVNGHRIFCCSHHPSNNSKTVKEEKQQVAAVNDLLGPLLVTHIDGMRINKIKKKNEYKAGTACGVRSEERMGPV